jgi:Uma2 family endonuclease
VPPVGERASPQRQISPRPQSASVLQPDAQWFAHGRALNDPTTRPQPLGDIVVEVRSASTWHRDVGIKRTLYEQHGARELWLIDPATQTVVVHSRSIPDAASFDTSIELGPNDQLTSPLLPDFSADVAELFA